MSLDVSLYGPEEEVPCACSCGHAHTTIRREEYFSCNITHNLAGMAREAGVYQALWRPDEISLTKASELIPILEAALVKLESDPSFYSRYNPPNGWGSYDGLVGFVREYLEACIAHPNASIEVSR